MSADDTSAEFAQDAVLFARMRAMWAQVDPMPADLIDRMVAAIAVDDLSREYALLTLVETDLAAVRGDGDVLTLQFSDGTVTVLLHITRTEQSTHRIDGWVDAPPVSVAIVHGADEERCGMPPSASTAGSRSTASAPGSCACASPCATTRARSMTCRPRSSNSEETPDG
jgi:hypothetical protein